MLEAHGNSVKLLQETIIIHLFEFWIVLWGLCLVPPFIIPGCYVTSEQWVFSPNVALRLETQIVLIFSKIKFSGWIVRLSLSLTTYYNLAQRTVYGNVYSFGISGKKLQQGSIQNGSTSCLVPNLKVSFNVRLRLFRH